MPKNEVFLATPKELRPYDLANEIRLRRSDEAMYRNYLYTINAISCGVGLNTKVKTIEKPLLQEYFEDLHLTEEERDLKEIQKMIAQEELYSAQLKARGYKEEF